MSTIVILSGGFGSRLRALTFDKPKCLVSVHGQTFLFVQIRYYAMRGFTDFVICTNHFSLQVEDECKKIRAALNVSIIISQDGPQPLGTGGAIVNSLDLLPESFLVTNGDSYLPFDPIQFNRVFVSSNNSLMAVVPPLKQSQSNLVVASNNIIKYKKSGGTACNYLDYGFLGFKKNHLAHFKKNTFLDAGEIYNQLIENGRLSPFFTVSPYFDVGSYCGYSSFLTHISR